MTTFDASPLAPSLLQAIQEMGYQKPTAIQTAAIHPILQGHDLIATAPTGTGKTAAFSLPLLHQLITDWQRPRELRTRALILSPTRELALQLHQTIEQLTTPIDLTPALPPRGQKGASGPRGSMGPRSAGRGVRRTLPGAVPMGRPDQA